MSEAFSAPRGRTIAQEAPDRLEDACAPLRLAQDDLAENCEQIERRREVVHAKPARGETFPVRVAIVFRYSRS